MSSGQKQEQSTRLIARLIEAAGRGDAAGVKRLIGSGRIQRMPALLQSLWAAENGHLDCVKALISVSDITVCGYRALVAAGKDLRVDCVTALLDAYPESQRAPVLLRLARNTGIPDDVHKIVAIYRSNTRLRKDTVKRMARPSMSRRLAP